MSAKRRSRRSRHEDSRVDLKKTDEVELHGQYNPISRIGSGVSKKSWHESENPGSDDVDYGQVTHDGVQMPTAMAVEPYSLQTHFPHDFRADKKEEEVDCFGRFKRTLRSCWKTRLTEDTKDNRELYVITSLRELIIYIFFVIILCVMTFGMFSPNMYYYTKIMKALFVDSTDFQQYTTMKDFFTYAKGGLLDGLYWEKYYNGDPVKRNHEGYIYFENKIIGTPRIRQVRVRNDSCTVAEDFQNEIKECFAPYSTSVEDKRPFGLKNDTQWEYRTSSQLGGPQVWGLISKYAAGGFAMLLGKTKQETSQQLDFLERHLWLDRATRAVFIDFTVYNANINLFCIVTLVFEYPATGGCVPFSQFKTMKLIRYVTTMDYVVLACEFIFALFIIYYTIEEILEYRVHGSDYIKDAWNIYDIIILIMGYVTLFFIVYVYVKVKNMLKVLLHQNTGQFADFATVGYYQDVFNQFIAIFVFLAWIKIFKYVSFSKTMTQLQSTLSRCAKDVAGFAIMFFIVFFAYAQWGYLLFGTQVKDYSTYGSCIFTLFRIILGDFDFPAMEAASRIMGPIYFITYVFFVFFVLINMFLAIINDTYAEVKSDLSQQEDEFELGDYFRRGYERLIDKLSFKKERIVDIQKALATADTNQDNKVDFEEWRMELKARGHADAEIEAVFAKYDLDGDRVLNEDEVKEMHEDLEGQKADLNQEIDEVAKVYDDNTQRKLSIDDEDMDEDDDSDSSSHGHRRRRAVPFEEFTVLSRRVDRLEHSIGSIVSKIDAVLLKLEAMDKAKMKRRETMNRLLDTISDDGVKRTGDDRRQEMETLVRDELEKWDADNEPKEENGRPVSSMSNKSKESRISVME